MQATESPNYRELVKRAIDAGKYDLLPVWFRSTVLDRYRGDPDCRILRTDSAGRLRGPGGWMLNFGISPDDALIHLSISTALGIPEGHREHWLSHLVSPPVGENFLRMVMTPGACIDDGRSREW
ncbi:MAG TPA: hypothetical protein VFC51_02110 [Chloroflexota bacterium]|nr:hypothetical protein [Chloroflexota bacterium]